jgi:hypothetical protein
MKIKGYIGQQGIFTYFTDGHQVYRTSDAIPILDVTTGYPVSARWECSVAHWQHYCGRIYGLPPVAEDQIVAFRERQCGRSVRTRH